MSCYVQLKMFYLPAQGLVVDVVALLVNEDIFFSSVLARLIVRSNVLNVLCLLGEFGIVGYRGHVGTVCCERP